jgi:hypothetical protein
VLLTALVVTIGSIGSFSFRAAYGHFLSRHIRIYGMWFFTPHALLHVVSFGLLGFLASLISERWPVRTCAIAERCSAGLRDRMGPIPVPSGQPV